MKEPNFLKDFVELCKDTEIPDLFALWSGISGVSCALGRNVWIDMGHYQIFPNLYIVLVAGSGRMRKSTSVNQVEKLLRQLQPPPNLIAQKITPEALIQAMRTQEVDGENNFLAEACTGFAVIDELSTFLNKDSYQSGLPPLLINLYDCKESFEYRTKGGGTERITNACLGLLGASTIEWIRSAIPEDAVGGGLTSRIIFIYLDTPPTPVAWTSMTEEKRGLLETLVKTLHHISTYRGEVAITPEAKHCYIQSYEKWVSQSKLFDDRNLSGYASRRSMHMLKLSIILAAVECPAELCIELHHVKGAERMLSIAENHMELVMSLITSSEHGASTTQILNMVRKAQRLPRTILIQSMSHKYTSREIGEIIETLLQSGKIRMVVNGKSTYYECCD